jgi:phage baseplate assembly protein W
VPEPKDLLEHGLALHGGAQASLLDLAEDVRRSILTILSTMPGELPERPELGCRIHDLSFAAPTPHTIGMAAMYCEAAIKEHEPRAAHVSCRATAALDEHNRIDVIVRYVVAGDSESRKLVYPFYLRAVPPASGRPVRTDAESEARSRVAALVAAFEQLEPTDEILELFNAVYRRRQVRPRLEESGGAPYSEPSLHAAFEWLLTSPLHPVPVQDVRAELDEGAWDAMRSAFSTVDADLIAEFFTRARQAGFDPDDPAALASALQIAMLRYVDRGTSDQLA